MAQSAKTMRSAAEIPRGSKAFEAKLNAAAAAGVRDAVAREYRCNPGSIATEHAAEMLTIYAAAGAGVRS